MVEYSFVSAFREFCVDTPFLAIAFICLTCFVGIFLMYLVAGSRSSAVGDFCKFIFCFLAGLYLFFHSIFILSCAFFLLATYFLIIMVSTDGN